MTASLIVNSRPIAPKEGRIFYVLNSAHYVNEAIIVSLNGPPERFNRYLQRKAGWSRSISLEKAEPNRTCPSAECHVRGQPS